MIKEIETRRSIRQYADKEVTKNDLETLLRAAMHAPTARNLQEWRFTVSNNKQVLKDLSLIPAYKMLENAGAVIIVSGDLNINSAEFIYVDCAAAVENILLEAKAMGIGTCWCACAPRADRMDAIKKYLKLDDNILPVAVISIGYPLNEIGIEDRYDEKKITWL